MSCKQSLPEKVDENAIKIDDLEAENVRLELEKQDKTDSNINDPSNEVVGALNNLRDDVDGLFGSIEIKAYLRTENNIVTNYLANIPQQPIFTKDIETDPAVLSYNEITNNFFISSGISFLDTTIRLSNILTGVNTNMTIRLKNLQGDIIATDNRIIPAGQPSWVVTPNDLANIPQDENFVVELEFDRNITVNSIRNIFDRSLTSSLFSNNVAPKDMVNESPTGTAMTQENINKELTNVLAERRERTTLYGKLKLSDGQQTLLANLNDFHEIHIVYRGSNFSDLSQNYDVIKVADITFGDTKRNVKVIGNDSLDVSVLSFTFIDSNTIRIDATTGEDLAFIERIIGYK